MGRKEEHPGWFHTQEAWGLPEGHDLKTRKAESKQTQRRNDVEMGTDGDRERETVIEGAR